MENNNKQKIYSAIDYRSLTYIRSWAVETKKYYKPSKRLNTCDILISSWKKHTSSYSRTNQLCRKMNLNIINIILII